MTESCSLDNKSCCSGVIKLRNLQCDASHIRLCTPCIEYRWFLIITIPNSFAIAGWPYTMRITTSIVSRNARILFNPSIFHSTFPPLTLLTNCGLISVSCSGVCNSSFVLEVDQSNDHFRNYQWKEYPTFRGTFKASDAGTLYSYKSRLDWRILYAFLSHICNDSCRLIGSIGTQY